MKQVAISGGEVRVVDVPVPALRPGAVLVRTSHSLISSGTEGAGVGARRAGLLARVARNPALVKKVLEHAAERGLRSTVDLVRCRVRSESALGYSTSGVVTEVAPDVSRFRVGDRVACAGGGYANHAAVNVVPQNLAAVLPDTVGFDEGAFATLGAIALQGVRRAAPGIGDQVAVLGLGLIGQIAAQILRASGAVVIGADVRADRVERARSLGLAHGFTLGERGFAAGVRERTGGRGADVVIVAAAGRDPEILNGAIHACRRKGRVVLVGDVPITLAREELYKKEIDFLISTSYGPGRYDPEYEEKGHDYPLAYVRWTEGRNLEEVVRLMAERTLQVRPLADLVQPVERAPEAYAALLSPERPIGVLLDFHLDAPLPARPAVYVPARASVSRTDGFGVGVVGHGGYFRSTLLPLLQAHGGFRLESACARNGLTVRAAVENDGFARGTTDYRELLSDPKVDVVYIATRHNLHYEIARAAVLAGKSVFVEKPMTLTVADGKALADLVAERKALLTVGFNRRFSPHAARLRGLLAPIAAPKTFVYRVNAGPLPPESWVLDPVEGGGRLLGEGVHFFDLLAFLAGAAPVRVQHAGPAARRRDEGTVTIELEDGSLGTVVYAVGGAPEAGKERLEVFAGGGTFVLDDFRSLDVHGVAGAGTRTKAIEKGQREQLENFYRALRGEAALGVTAADGLRATWCAEQAIG